MQAARSLHHVGLLNALSITHKAAPTSGAGYQELGEEGGAPGKAEHVSRGQAQAPGGHCRSQKVSHATSRLLAVQAVILERVEGREVCKLYAGGSL